jgi:endonuclease YncB( thermonuclease family)
MLNKIKTMLNQAGDIFDDVEYCNIKPFIPQFSRGKVVKVYDGDTITVAATLQFANSPIYRFSVRLSGIDSPEFRGSSENEKKHAIISRDALHELIYGKMITLHNISTEKYGRILADIYIDGIHVNKWLIDNNYAVPYDGGTKVRDIEWDKDM